MTVAAIPAPSVSVLIPTKNGGTVFPQLLEGLKMQDYTGGLELIVIDSGSTDHTVAIASQYGATVMRIPPNQFDHGLTRNRAIEAASGNIVVLMSQDAVPGDRHLVRYLVQAFDDPKVAGAYARQVPREEADVLTKRDASRLLAGRTIRAVRRIEDWTVYRNLSPLERYHFCNFDNVCSAIRRDVWRSIPFRATEFGEDIDWGQRVLEAGWKIVYCPQAYAIHSHPLSLKYLYDRHRLNSRTLSQQFGVDSQISTRGVIMRTIRMMIEDWAYVIGHEEHVPELVRHLARIPFYSFARVYGQWRGEMDARRKRNS